jgi:hypothetical protein
MYDIGSERPAKRSLAEKNQTIQAFLFYRTHKPFCECITIGRPNWTANWLHALSIQVVSEIIRVFCIAVHDEVPTV